MIIVGDVHGCFKELQELMQFLPQTKDICFVGDLIDRGPDSNKVLEFVRDNGYLSVMGNHEDMIDDYNLWFSNGGWATVKSFGGLDEFKGSGFIDWMYSLPISIRYKDFLISHSYAWAGDDTPVEDLLWGRIFKSKPEGDFVNIFGHTPFKKPLQVHGKHWCIDTGCFLSGILTALDLDTMTFYNNKGDIF